MLLALGYSKPPPFIGVQRLHCGNSYLGCVHVIIYERPRTDHIRRICHVVEATTPRWTFKGGMRETAREALALLRHEAEEQMEQSQYRHFLSRAREGAEVVVIPVGDHDHIGCFTDQVKLTHALVQDLDEAIKEVNLLGEHDEYEDDDDKGNPIVPLAPAPAVMNEEIIEEGAPVEMVPKQEAPVAHEVILAEVEPEPP
jgi:hypothetical protein